MPTVTAITFHFVLINRQTPVFPIDYILTSGIIAFTALVLFVALSAVGLGHISWTANELFPMHLGVLGTGYFPIVSLFSMMKDISLSASSIL